jgi:hypothetical protein
MKISTKCRPPFLLRAALAAVVLCVGTQNVLAVDYTRLVDSNPVPPLSAPESSSKVLRVGSIMKLAVQAGPAFNRTVTFGELRKAFDAELKRGLEKATAQGQAGVLLRVRLYEQTTDSGTFFSFGGGPGATLVGVGSDPDAACYATRCFDKLEADIPAQGSRLAAGSGYVWVRPDGHRYEVSLYRADRLEGRARVTFFSQESKAAYEQTMASATVKGYGQALANRIRDSEDRKAVDKLMRDRQEAVEKLQAVEKKLAQELRKAERASKTSATLNQFAGALSLTSTVAMASASLGEDLSKSEYAPFKSKEAVLDAVSKFGAKAGQDVKALEIQQRTFRDSATGSTLQLYQIGVRYDMAAPTGTGLP